MADEITYEDMAAHLGRTKGSIQSACQRYAAEAPKPVRAHGKTQYFDKDAMLAFFVWYDKTARETTGAKRSPRNQVEILESNLTRHLARLAKADASVANWGEGLAKAKAEQALVQAKIEETKKALAFARRTANRSK